MDGFKRGMIYINPYISTRGYTGCMTHYIFNEYIYYFLRLDKC